MTDTKYTKALFLGTMKDGSMEKRAALMARKQQLNRLANSSMVSVSDRSSALRELNEINGELSSSTTNAAETTENAKTAGTTQAARTGGVRPSQVQTTGIGKADAEDKINTPAYKVELSEFPTRRAVEQPKDSEVPEQQEAEAAAMNIQQNADNIMVQANMTRPEVMALIM